MLTKESFTVRQIKKLYNIDIESSNHQNFYKQILIKVYIDFIPKEETIISPATCHSYGKWLYNIETGNLSFEDFIYIRNSEMPILNYTGQEYYWDNYCENLGFNEVNRVLRSLGYDVSFSPPNTEY